MPAPALINVEKALSLDEAFQCFQMANTEAEMIYDNMLNGIPMTPYQFYSNMQDDTDLFSENKIIIIGVHLISLEINKLSLTL